MKPAAFGRSLRSPILFAALLAALAAVSGIAWQTLRPPETRIEVVTDDYHGTKVADPYRWLEDQQSPETRAWIDAQNRYTRSVLDALPGRAAITARLDELMRVDTIQTPLQRGSRIFYMKRLASQDLYVLYMRNSVDSADEVLVDPHPMSKDHTTSVALEGASHDGSILAYGVREGGADEVSIHLLNVATRSELPDRLPKADYLNVGAFAFDNSGLYYSTITRDGPRVMFHKMGTDPASDSELFGHGYGPDKIAVATLSEDGRYLFVHVFYGSSATHSEVYFEDLAKGGKLVPLVNHIEAGFIAQGIGDQAFINTNWKAPKGRVLVADLKNPSPDHWREIVPESDAVIEELSLYGGSLLLHETRDAHSVLRLYRPDGKLVGDVSLPALGTVGGISAHWDSPDAFFSFESFFIPPSIRHLRLEASRYTERAWAAPPVPIHAESLAVRQVWYHSKDGTRIPMFLVHRKNLSLDGAGPALLTGYGGFDVSETPSFSAFAVLFAERGGVYALANLRGGGEFGEAWHSAGMLGKKQNVFDDFTAAAQWLIQNKYTSPAKLSIRGTSNGGLLVGAALVERPDLFGAVVCRYPLIDMLRFQLFLVARLWVPEYGSSDDPTQFKFISAYSPYQHVVSGVKYPAVLLVTGDSDTRVPPLHARKMAARLQAATSSGKPVLLLYDTQSGHSGGRPLGKQIEEATDELVFLFGELGVSMTP